MARPSDTGGKGPGDRGAGGRVIGRIRGGGVVLLLAVLLSTATISSGAVATASVARGGAADVGGDADGPVALVDGSSGDAVGYTPGGELTVDVARLGLAMGLGPSAIYEFGDPDDPADERAFDVVNRGTDARRVDVSYALSPGSADGDPDANVKLYVYRPSGTLVATASEEGGAATFEIGAGGVVHVVVVVDTRGLTTDDDPSGTIEVSVG